MKHSTHATLPKCRAFSYQFSKAASIGENIEFLRGMLTRLQRWVCTAHARPAFVCCC